MAKKLMYIPNDDWQLHHLSRLQFVVETFEMNQPVKVSKVVTPMNKKTFFQNFGD